MANVAEIIQRSAIPMRKFEIVALTEGNVTLFQLRPGSRSGPIGIRWSSSYWGEIASGFITADMASAYEGWFRIQIGNLDQRIILVPRPRHFGNESLLLGCLVASRYGPKTVRRLVVAAGDGLPIECPDELLVCRVIVTSLERPADEPFPESTQAVSPSIEHGDRTPLEIQHDERRFHRRLDYPSLGPSYG